MSRKLKINDNIILLLEQAIQNGMSIKLACQYAGISTASYFAWMNRGKEEQDTLFSQLHDRIKKAEAQSALMNLALIQKAAKDGTWQAAAWILERRHNYSIKQDPLVEVNIDSRQISVHQLLQEIQNSDQELQELISRPEIDLEEE